MRKPLLFVVMAAVVLNSLATFIGRGSFLHTVALMALCMWIVAPVLLLAGVTMVVAAKHGARGYYRAAQVALLGALALGSLCISALTGGLVRERDIAEAKRYCESYVPSLDRHRSEHGKYPPSLDEVARTDEVPRLLANATFYWPDGDEFRFEFGDPGALMSFITDDSERRAWETRH